ncbi:hypothetical protein [Sphingomonas sanxanigenens]|uniref:hypothetical protein n=1 Tax=Sphingomonas sanxanigenens TaxID=397260 RepID=UPI0013017BF7|nr:hypothetical protein [Sphingomonas sanxanigenens]
MTGKPLRTQSNVPSTDPAGYEDDPDRVRWVLALAALNLALKPGVTVEGLADVARTGMDGNGFDPDGLENSVLRATGWQMRGLLRDWTICRARELAVIFEAATGTKITINGWPRDGHKQTNFTRFFCAVLELAFGVKRVSDLADVLEEARAWHREDPARFGFHPVSLLGALPLTLKSDERP